MNKPKDKIEELFQSHSDDFDKMPDDSLWDSIEAKLPPVPTPGYKIWRWGLAAALLLFSLAGYVAYLSINTVKKPEVIGAKENGLKNDAEAKKIINRNDTKTTPEANQNGLTQEDATKEPLADREAKNGKIIIANNINRKEKIKNGNKADKWFESKSSVKHNPVAKSFELITLKGSRGNSNKDHTRVSRETHKQVEPLAINEKEINERFSAPDYLSGHVESMGNDIPFNTRISYEAEYKPEEEKVSIFKIPSEGYVSFTPSLSYYRVFSSMPINQFNGANNGGRLGWAVQAGVVYPLKLRRLSYRVGLGFFTAQSNFKYSMLSGRQQPIRLNNNTFEYVNIESTQLESKRWQVLEIQNDLMYKIRPMQEFVLGFKAGGSIGEKPVFDAYTGYRLSKALSHRQTIWIEAAYAYAINARQSSRNAFSYHMDKYSLRIGLNYR